MKAEQLVQGQPYLWVDEDGQSRPSIFKEKVTLPDGGTGYRFLVHDYRRQFVVLPKSEVERVVFRSSITPL